MKIKHFVAVAIIIFATIVLYFFLTGYVFRTSTTTRHRIPSGPPIIHK